MYMSVDLMKTNFDNALFNIEFEKNKKEKEKDKRLSDEERLRKMNKEMRAKKMSEMSMNELMIEWKISVVGILNDLLNLNWNINTIFGGDRLFYVGLTIIICSVIFYILSWIFAIGAKDGNRNVNEYRIFVEK